MKGIEAAFFGSVATEHINLQTGPSGKPWAALSVRVTVGTLDDGKDLSQWIRVSCFGETAERVAATFKKGDRCYCEGTLTLIEWNDKVTGEPKHGLSVNAYKVEKVGVSNLGRNKPKREIDRQFAQAEPTPYVPPRTQISAPTYAGPAYGRGKPKIMGRDDFNGHPFDDELPI
jgi:single-stranded DNA-binding protein